ncbi:TPA: hypothetical protein DEP90_03510 [Patescibacteria group bacterium]|nr:hypothetical protein [Patescibacteria group bacterium]
MKNTLQINKKKILPVITGVLFVALTLKSVNEISPTSILNQDLSGEITVYAANTVNIEQMNIENLDVDKSKGTATYTGNSSIDSQTENIRKYLNKRNSPLAKYAEEFVKAANNYGIDYRLVAAISVVESSGGIYCFRPYNAWGWGKSGFNSWKDGIWAVSKGLSKYYSSGVNTPRKIAYRYCPPNAVKWGNNVSYVMNLIENQ